MVKDIILQKWKAKKEQPEISVWQKLNNSGLMEKELFAINQSAVPLKEI